MPAEQFRRDRMLALADLSAGVGLEIGPLDRPIAVRPEQDVRYVDVFDEQALARHYAGDPTVDGAAIVPMDFTLAGDDGEIRSLVEAVGGAAPFRWVVASHVIEHVPDLLGWLADVAELLEDGGSLVLAVPDRRYTFDVQRPPTTVGQVLDAHETRDAIPSIRAVYDYFSSIVTVTAVELWAGEAPGDDRVMYGQAVAQEHLERVRRHEYVDVHVWVFTPGELVQQIVELGRMGLVDLTVSAVVPTSLNELEFYVALTRIPRRASPDEVAALRAAGLQHFADEVPAVAPATEPTPEPAPEAVPEPSVEPAAAGVTPVLLSTREARLIQAKRSVINTLLRR